MTYFKTTAAGRDFALWHLTAGANPLKVTGVGGLWENSVLL